MNDRIINNIKSLYGSSVAVQLDSNYYYLSSSEHSSDGVRYVKMYYGTANGGYKDQDGYIRAFCALPA